MAKEKKEAPNDSAKVMFELADTIEIEGKTYRFSPLKLRPLMEFASLLRETGENPLYIVQNPELAPKLIRALEICFAPHHPEIQGEAILDMFDAEAAEKILTLVLRLSIPKKA